MQQIPPEWLQQLDELLSLSLAGDSADADREAQPLERLAAADPDLLAFLVDQFAAQDTPQAAAILEGLATHTGVVEPIRAQARTALDDMASRGIAPAPPGKERFFAGWVQEGRERGEQILMLGWRLAGGDNEALVFLLDWRGDGLKDYYRTRRMRAGEWRQLVEHNGAKGAPLVEVSLAEARALLEAVLAESRRFSRPMPREYKLDSRLIERRILQAAELPADPPTYVSASLTPEQVVAAYIAALHYRDYRLAADLLASEHPVRAGRPASEAADALRAQLKHAPRRDEDAQISALQASADEVIVQAAGTQALVERTGRRVRQEVAERYTVRRQGDVWRIATCA
jgi:hypothetical protein